MTKHQRITIDCDDATAGFTAAYLRLAPNECAFIESYTSHALPRLLGALEDAGRSRESVRYVVVTHAHLDHAAGAGALLVACPNATLLAHPRAARHLIDPSKLIASATSVYGEERFAKLYGVISPIPKERVRALEDGESFELGGSKLTVWHTKGHANHHFIVDDPELDSVYTGDTFGLVYPALQKNARFAIPSTSPTNFDGPEAHKGIDKVLSLGRKYACLTHFGAFEDTQEIGRQLHAWIDRAEAWVSDAAKGSGTMEEVTATLEKAWRQAVEEDASARNLGFESAAFDLLKLDVELNAQGLAFVALEQRKRG
jgi:glyoxylase-like metal-dependent hydrolase (beta-lactamase superfamily II)